VKGKLEELSSPCVCLTLTFIFTEEFTSISCVPSADKCSRDLNPFLLNGDDFMPIFTSQVWHCRRSTRRNPNIQKIGGLNTGTGGMVLLNPNLKTILVKQVYKKYT
jgi:hypothetical protein